MKRYSQKLFLTPIAAALITAMGSTVALASHRDLLATTVPASACEPVNSSDAARIRLSNGAWVFRGANTGQVSFNCPLPVNANTVSDNTDANYISSYRIYFRDTDVLGNQAEVRVRLRSRSSTGLAYVSPQWSSNGAVYPGPTNTRVCERLNHNLNNDQIYHFLMSLRRSNTNQNPAFTGIDFADLYTCPSFESL